MDLPYRRTQTAVIIIFLKDAAHNATRMTACQYDGAGVFDVYAER